MRLTYLDSFDSTDSFEVFEGIAYLSHIKYGVRSQNLQSIFVHVFYLPQEDEITSSCRPNTPSRMQAGTYVPPPRKKEMSEPSATNLRAILYRTAISGSLLVAITGLLLDETQIAI